MYLEIKERILNLSSYPERGHQPRELETVGLTEYLKIHFKPYRIMYQIQGTNVIVHCIPDGRRDLEELLHKRLVR